MYGAKYDVLVYIYNSYAGILGEFLSNQDPVKCLMLDEALNMRVYLSLSYLEFPKIWQLPFSIQCIAIINLKPSRIVKYKTSLLCLSSVIQYFYYKNAREMWFPIPTLPVFLDNCHMSAENCKYNIYYL